MIARFWKGTVRPAAGDRYLRHLVDVVIPDLSALDGFNQVLVLRRRLEGGDEFAVVTMWDSVDAIRGFAGPDEEAAVVPPAAQALLASYDTRAVHYEVAHGFTKTVRV